MLVRFLVEVKRPGQHIFLKVSREGYADRGHPACCVRELYALETRSVSTLADSFDSGNS